MQRRPGPRPLLSANLAPAGLALLGLLLMTGCPTVSFESDEEQIEFHAARVCFEPPDASILSDDCVVSSPDLVGIPWATGFANNRPLLQGTILCLGSHVRGGNGASIDECFDVEAEGDATSLEHPTQTCWNLGDESTTWTYTPRQEAPDGDDDEAPDCTPDDEELVVDTLRVDVVTTAEIVPQILAWPEMGALQFGLTLPNGDELPEEIADPLTLPLLVAEGEPVLLNLGLHDPESETLLWWNPSESSVALTAVAGPVGVLTAGLSDDAPPEQADAFAVTLAPGSVSSLSMSLPEAEFELGELRAAPESDIESLELVVGMYSLLDVVQPMAAIAVARDAEGNRIHGAPIRWSVRGRALAIDHRGDQLGYGDLAGRDYTWVRDDCQRPSAGIGTKSSTLVAEVNGIEAVQKLTWVRTEPGDPEAADADWTRPDVCTGQGCGGCSTTASAQPGRSFSAVALLALLVGVRRRRRG